MSYHGGIHLDGVLGLPRETGTGTSRLLSVRFLRSLPLPDTLFEALSKITNGWSLTRRSCLFLPKLGEYGLATSWVTRPAEGLRTLSEDWGPCRPNPRRSLSTSQTCRRYVGLGDRVLVTIARSASSNCAGLGATATWDNLELLEIAKIVRAIYKEQRSGKLANSFQQNIKSSGSSTSFRTSKFPKKMIQLWISRFTSPSRYSIIATPTFFSIPDKLERTFC